MWLPFGVGSSNQINSHGQNRGHWSAYKGKNRRGNHQDAKTSKMVRFELHGAVDSISKISPPILIFLIICKKFRIFTDDKLIELWDIKDIDNKHRGQSNARYRQTNYMGTTNPIRPSSTNRRFGKQKTGTP